jgi:hypothetical protein
MIGNFPLKQSYNPGGYSTFYFIQKQYVSSFPITVNGVAAAPLMFWSQKDWLTGYATRGTLQYTEDTQSDANGLFYVKTITGFIPGDRPELISMLEDMVKERFIVLLKDPQGNYRLIGTPAAPLEFTANFSSGSANSDEKGYRFTFTVNSIVRSPVYSI